MQNNLAELASQVTHLPKDERLKLAHILLSVDNESQKISELDELWESEITQRVKSVENGTAIGLDFNNSIQTIRSMLS